MNNESSQYSCNCDLLSCWFGNLQATELLGEEASWIIVFTVPHLQNICGILIIPVSSRRTVPKATAESLSFFALMASFHRLFNPCSCLQAIFNAGMFSMPLQDSPRLCKSLLFHFYPVRRSLKYSLYCSSLSSHSQGLALKDLSESEDICLQSRLPNFPSIMHPSSLPPIWLSKASVCDLGKHCDVPAH